MRRHLVERPSNGLDAAWSVAQASLEPIGGEGQTLARHHQIVYWAEGVTTPRGKSNHSSGRSRDCHQVPTTLVIVTATVGVFQQTLPSHAYFQRTCQHSNASPDVSGQKTSFRDPERPDCNYYHLVTVGPPTPASASKLCRSFLRYLNPRVPVLLSVCYLPRLNRTVARAGEKDDRRGSLANGQTDWVFWGGSCLAAKFCMPLSKMG